jgi:hypothetical protein
MAACMQPHDGSELQKRSSHCTSGIHYDVPEPQRRAEQRPNGLTYSTRCAHTQPPHASACKAGLATWLQVSTQTRAAPTRQEVPGERTSAQPKASLKHMLVTTRLNPSPHSAQLQGCITMGPFAGLSSLQQQQQQQRADPVSKKHSRHRAANTLTHIVLCIINPLRNNCRGLS